MRDARPDCYGELIAARVAALGLVLGPMNHQWYRLLDGRIGGRTGKDIAVKVAADFAVSPIFACTFIAGGLPIISYGCLKPLHDASKSKIVIASN